MKESFSLSDVLTPEQMIVLDRKISKLKKENIPVMSIEFRDQIEGVLKTFKSDLQKNGVDHTWLTYVVIYLLVTRN